MDLNDIIRAFFGFRGPSTGPPSFDKEEFSEDGGSFGFFGPGFNQPRRNTLDGDDDDDDVVDDDSNDDMLWSRGGFGWGSHSNDEFSNFEKESQEMLRHFEEMFRNFGFSDFNSNLPSLETIPNRRSISPRDEMLKQPDELQEKVEGHSDDFTKEEGRQSDSTDKDNRVRFGDVFRSPWHWNIPALPSSTDREDKDLDEHAKDGRLDEILKPKQQQPLFRSFSKSVSIQTIRKPDGTIEQRRTEKDSQGNVTTTVTTSQDDQTPVLTRPSKPSSKWSNCSKRPKCSDKWPNHQSPDDGDPQRQSLFDKFFGSWNR